MNILEYIAVAIVWMVLLYALIYSAAKQAIRDYFEEKEYDKLKDNE